MNYNVITMVKRHYLKIFYIKSFFSFGSTRSHPLSPLLPHKTIWQPPDVICNNVPWLLLPTSSSSSRSVNGGEEEGKGNCLKRLQRELEFSIDSFFIMKSHSLSLLWMKNFSSSSPHNFSMLHRNVRFFPHSPSLFPGEFVCFQYMRNCY